MPRAGELITRLVGHLVTDEQVSTTCPSCAQLQSLSTATLGFADPMRMAYLCRSCGDPILIIGLAIDLTWPPARGVRAGAYSLRNPSDLIVWVEGENTVTVPANRHALDEA